VGELDVAPETALERVRVGVDEAREQEAIGQPLHRGVDAGEVRGGEDRHDAPGVDPDGETGARGALEIEEVRE
jgi:hypothetical protein